MDLKELRIDPELADGGVWVDYDGTTKFLIAMWLNRHFSKAVSAMSKRYRHLINSQDPEVLDEKFNGIIAKHILLGWQGLTDGGNPLPYSVETAQEILASDTYRPFRRWVIEVANDDSLFSTPLDESRGYLLGKSES